MGRKRPNTTKNKACSILLKPSLADDIERLSKKLMQSRHQTMINLIVIGLAVRGRIGHQRHSVLSGPERVMMVTSVIDGPCDQ